MPHESEFSGNPRKNRSNSDLPADPPSVRLSPLDHPHFVSASDLESQCQEPQILRAIEWFATYLISERAAYYQDGKPLGPILRAKLQDYFQPALLDAVRILELAGHRVQNPWFYPQARELGWKHLPDVTHKSAITFLDVVVFNDRMNGRDLFHGLVHAAQVSVLGIDTFSDLFVRGFLKSRSYFLVPLKAHAFALDARFASNPADRFSVEREIRQWSQENRY